MSPAPLIGISIAAIPHRSTDAPFMGIRLTYPNAVALAGGVPLLIPSMGDVDALRHLFEHLDGIILSGGADVDAAAYGSESSPFNGHSDPARDSLEFQLVRWAVEADKPLLGICRGIQVLNVALGGTLIQDIRDEVPDALRHDSPAEDSWFRRTVHDVELASGSKLHDALGETRLEVNSLHHQAVARVASSLVVSACATDGIVEGIEHPECRFIVGVQWHPEALADQFTPMRRLFEALVQAASS